MFDPKRRGDLRPTFATTRASPLTMMTTLLGCDEDSAAISLKGKGYAKKIKNLFRLIKIIGLVDGLSIKL
jgi:hypothetical protein